MSLRTEKTQSRLSVVKNIVSKIFATICVLKRPAKYNYNILI